MFRFCIISLVALCTGALLASCNVVSGVDDLSFECGTALLPAGDSCPPECNGHCADGDSTCVFNCAAPNPAVGEGPSWCLGEGVLCPPGMHCLVQCRAQSGGPSCSGATVTCPDDYRCTVACDGDAACRDTVILCSETGPCSLSCMEGIAPDDGIACFSTDLICGLNECTAECGPNAGKANVTCGDSCGCTTCE